MQRHSFAGWYRIQWAVRVLGCCGLALVLRGECPADETAGTWQIVGRAPTTNAAGSEIEVAVTGAGREDAAHAAIPVRAIVTDRGGQHVDGSGYGLYADGRFFADGTFRVVVAPGETHFDLRSGPNYVPLQFTVEAEAGNRLKIAVQLHEWFRPERLGWYAGDNHVHAQHDAHAAVKTGLAYLSLQARANGLNFVTEAGSNVSYEDLNRLDTERFLLRYAAELRPGAFVGHFNTPGITVPISTQEFEQLAGSPLPGQAFRQEVHRRGGVTIHTHPLVPPHLRHWMGATEILSDAVLTRCADLLDLDSEATEQLWFAVLNLGNRIGASGSTDAALGRIRTPSPGDRRVYCKADALDYRAIVHAMQQGRTIATNGGPVFATLTMDGAGPGDTLKPTTMRSVPSTVHLYSLYPLRSAALYYRGNPVQEFAVTGQTGHRKLERHVQLPDARPGWYVLRAEDQRGHWAITSPIYVGEPTACPDSSLVLLEISNHERFVRLRREFFAHVIVTVPPNQQLRQVELLKDGAVQKRIVSADGDQLHEGRIPVTQMPGGYGPGWIWHSVQNRNVHFQADLPVREGGWYSVRVATSRGSFASDSLHFDTANPNSQAISVATLRGGDTHLTLHGFGEEMALATIEGDATEGDHWWYPANTYWCLTTSFAGRVKRLGSPETASGARRFRTGIMADRPEPSPLPARSHDE